MDTVVYLQPAFILQHRPYQESAMLLDVYTRDYGVISLLAKGIRKEKSRLAGILLPFTLINISYLAKHDLKLLTQAEFVANFPLQRLALYCGFYLNELLQKFLHKEDPHPELFICYQHCLAALCTRQNIEQTLRYFELDLLQETGYGAALDWDAGQQTPVQPHLRYHFAPGTGMVQNANGQASGITLQQLTAKAALDNQQLQEAKHLTRKMLEVHLQGKPLKSREVLKKIMQLRVSSSL